MKSKSLFVDTALNWNSINEIDRFDFYIRSLNEFKNANDVFIAQAADILLDNFNRRLPLSEELIAAAIVDPSIQHLEAVDDWIQLNNTTRYYLIYYNLHLP